MKKLLQKGARLAGKMVLALSAVGLTLVVVELVMKVAWPISARPAASELRGRKMHEYDELLGWRNTPSGQRDDNQEVSAGWNVNSRGLRGPEYSYEKPANEYRILILGDSFANGTAVPFEQLCSEILETELNSATNDDRRYEVINASTGGHGTDQELLYFEREGRKYHPDLTILLFYYNDIWDNAQKVLYGGSDTPKPFFELTDGQLVLRNVPVPKKPSLRFAGKAPNLGAARLVKEWLRNSSRIYQLTVNCIKKHYGLHRLALRLGLVTVSKREVTELAGEIIPRPPMLGCWEKEYSAEIRYSWELTEALLERLGMSVKAAGSEFLVFNVPLEVCIYEKVLAVGRKQYGLNDNWQPDRVGRELVRVCGRYGLDCIEATEHMREKAQMLAKEETLLYIPGEGHWTAAGHRLVGEMLAEYVRGK